MPAKRKALVRRKGRTVEVPRWVHEYNLRKKRERKAQKKQSCQK